MLVEKLFAEIKSAFNLKHLNLIFKEYFLRNIMDLIKIVQRNQPNSYVGFITHSFAWVFSSFSDVLYPNPRFNKFANEGVVIYCIHGTADRVSSFNKVATEMLKDLPSNISAIRLISFNQRGLGKGIQYFAEELSKKIKKNGDKNIILMGHSRGGLVAAYFTEFLAKAQDVTVHAVVSICSPFRGSDVATAPLTWFSKSVQQMRRDSEFLNELGKEIRHTHAKYYYYAAGCDGLVTSESASLGPNPVMFDEEGHLSVMRNSACIAYFKNNIKELSQSLANTETDIAILANICYRIDEQVKNIKSRSHLKSSLAKERALVELKLMLEEKYTNKCNHYPDAKTVGDFFKYFLSDKTLNIQSNVTQGDILNTHLNTPFSMLSFGKSNTETFIESMLKFYNDIPLPSLAEECLLEEKSYSTTPK